MMESGVEYNHGQMLKQLKLNLWFVLVGTALVTRISYFFIKNQIFSYFWDYLGHIQEAVNASWPWVGGWNNLYWGGYPTLTYPPASHWLLKALITLTGSSSAATALFVILSIILLLHSLWIFSGKRISNQNQRLVAFSLSIAFYILSPVNSLVSLKGTLFSGTITAIFAISLLIYFLSSRKWHVKGLWLGILLLSHTLTSSMAILFMMVELVYLFFSSSTKKFIKIKHWLYSLLLAEIIGLPWILPFLDQKFQHTAFNISGRFFNLSIICLILLAISLITQLINKKVPSKFLIFTLLAGLLSIMPLWPTKIIEQYLLRGIHFYRYYSFLIILTPIVIMSNKNKFSDFFISKINLPIARTISVATILLTLLIPLSPFSYEFETYWDQVPEDISGKFIDTATKTDIDLFTRATDHLLAANTNLIGSFGLFFESSSTGMDYAVAKQLLNKESYGVPIYKIYIEELAGKIENTDYLLNLLGINYQAYTSKQEKEDDSITFARVEIKSEKNNLHRQHFYHLKKINDSQLVEPLAEEIKIDENLNLWEWWSNPEKKLTTREEHQPPTTLNLNLPQIENIKILPNKINFSVNSLEPAPIYIKFSHNAYWQAKALNKFSSTSQPMWVTPGNMVIYAAGDIELNWVVPQYLKTFGPISLITLVAAAAISIFKKTNKREH
jgi:hypothetical protein